MGIPDSDSLSTTEVMHESYIVNVSRVETSPNADRLRGVSVAICGVTTGFANECSHTQRQAGFGYRSALAASLCCVGGRNKHQHPTRSFRHRNQNLLGHSNCAVCRLPRHRAPGEEARLEIFDGNPPKRRNHFSRPLEGAVLSLASNANVDSSHVTLGALPAFRAMLGAGKFPACPLQINGVMLGLIPARKVKTRIGCRGDLCDAPVNSNGFFRWWKGFILAANHKGHVPMPLAITGNDAGFGFAWKLTTPHNRNGDATSKTELSVFDSESIRCVFQRRKYYFAAVKVWKAFGRLLERLLMRRVPFANGLLLDNMRSFAKPIVLGAKCREFLRHSAISWRIVLDAFLEHFVGSIARFHALIPHVASAIPFENQAAFGSRARAKSVRVSDSSLILAHDSNVTAQNRKSTVTRKVGLKAEVSTHKF